MEDEEDQHQISSSFQHHQLESITHSHMFPIESMKDVVATVSGYHGVERFNLIKLIAHSGASYVGNMSRSITHLVCWEFEGKKYELAEKFNTVVVNHRWIEDCIKQGKRLPEHPYVMQSGQEVGPISLEAPLVVKACASNKKKMVSDNSNHVRSGKSTRFGSQAFSNPVWTDSFLISENVIPGSQKNGDVSCKSRRRISKNSDKENQSRSRSFTADGPIPNQDRPKHKESSSYVSDHVVRDKRKISNVDVAAASAKFACKGRRLVKKNPDREGLGLQALDAGVRCNINTIQRQYSNDPAHSHSSNDTGGANVTEIRVGTDEWLYNQSRVVDGSYGYGDVMEMNDGESPDSIEKTSNGICSRVEKSGGGIISGSRPDHAARALTSPELSCVICWTDFSSTRGILPCGHRFCYSCIQEWADHMVSSGRALTCPLCKASFTNIMKVEGVEHTDQKVYSQTIPLDASVSEITILRDRETPYFVDQASPTVICCVCLSREPEDMLIRCNFCQNRQIHSYCLDPYLLPWACSQCKDLQMMYYRFR